MSIGGKEQITPDMERLISLIRNKEIVLWAGSGLSLYAGYPSGAAFCDIICDAAKSEKDRETPAAWLISSVHMALGFRYMNLSTVLRQMKL